MSHTIYDAKFEQMIIHQHVHLRQESQSHAPAHVLMRIYPIDKSLVCLHLRKKDVMLEFFIIHCTLYCFQIDIEVTIRSLL